MEEQVEATSMEKGGDAELGHGVKQSEEPATPVPRHTLHQSLKGRQSISRTQTHSTSLLSASQSKPTAVSTVKPKQITLSGRRCATMAGH